MNCPYCNSSIETHEPGEHLDRLFAEKVMGWKLVEKGAIYAGYGDYWRTIEGKRTYIRGWFKPSTDIALAMEGVEEAFEGD